MASFNGSASFAQKHSGDYTINNPKTVSVNSNADITLQASASVRASAESLFDELRQFPQGQSEPRPCRTGLEGKLIDANENLDATLALLQEIRAYLLG